MATTTLSTERAADIRLALGLTYLSLAWMTVEAAASLLLGAATCSLLLEGFGFDSLVELFSAGVLLWRLRLEWRRGADQATLDNAERRAARLVGYTLYGLAAFVVVSSAQGLLMHRRVDTHESAWGILIGIVAKIGMPLLAAAKLKVAARLQSRALRADAMEAITCGYLSLVLIVGLAATRLFGWWWLDSIAALGLVPFLIKEGREAVTGHCSCCSDDVACS
jgi:divalent metal cation (Fe/Co/Zn/Cd) transporter